MWVDAASANDACVSITIDKDDNIYCAGTTLGNLGEYNGQGNSVDAFIAKFNSSLELSWIRQLGAITIESSFDASGSDFCNGVHVDDAGNVYCAGHTTSALGANLSGSYDLFMVKLNSSGELQWLTQLGSSAIDKCNDIKVNDKGHVFCVVHL